MTDRFWSPDEYDARAHRLYHEGDLDGALETLKEGLALYPNAVELCVGLGHARLAREEFAWARIAFERALVLDPGHEDALVGMGEVLLRLGRTREGIELFRKAEALGYHDDVELMLTMGRALYREGLYSRARRVFARLAAARPECAEAIASMGYAVHRLGDDTEACRLLRAALRQDPDLHEARVYLAHLLYDRGDWGAALREFERVPPSDHWDSLAVWRVLELERTVVGLDEEDPALLPWQERLDELEAFEWDPVEEMLAEVEARVAGSQPWVLRDESQLELFDAEDGEAGAETGLVVRLEGGEVLRGTPFDIVRQFRDRHGFSHETVHEFMRRMAERWLEQHGVTVPHADAESFLRSAAGHGLLHLKGPDLPA